MHEDGLLVQDDNAVGRGALGKGDVAIVEVELDVLAGAADRREGQAGPLPGDRKMDVPEEQMTDVAVLAEPVEDGIRDEEARRVGKEGVVTGGIWGSAYH